MTSAKTHNASSYRILELRVTKGTQFGEDIHRASVVCVIFQISCSVLKRGRLKRDWSNVEAKFGLLTPVKVRERIGEMSERFSCA